jgi:hypothetical protein
MKTDVQGCSTCPAGSEQWEPYRSVTDKPLVQYDYRTPEGRLFACVAPTVERARRKRDAWLLDALRSACGKAEGE